MARMLVVRMRFVFVPSVVAARLHVRVARVLVVVRMGRRRRGRVPMVRHGIMMRVLGTRRHSAQGTARFTLRKETSETL
ncbi:MAG: hypothetical protein ACRENH_17115 [Gemmatimonadaceae bacterium]